jgi:voltage-gated potassium channel
VVAGQKPGQGQSLAVTEHRVVDKHGRGWFVLHGLRPESGGTRGARAPWFEIADGMPSPSWGAGCLCGPPRSAGDGPARRALADNLLPVPNGFDRVTVERSCGFVETLDLLPAWTDLAGSAPLSSPSNRLGEVAISGLAGFERSQLAKALIRSVAMVAVLLVVYYEVPVESRPRQEVVLRLTTAVIVFLVVLAIEVRAILKHEQPLLRAGVSMATIIPLFLVLFAWIYLTISRSNPGYFSTPLDRTESLYFTVTVFSTVGFGDIVPKVDLTRIVTMVQMLADLAVIGLVVRLIFGAASRGAAQREEPA